MISTLDFSGYRQACAELFSELEKRPEMYIRSVEDLEFLLFGHGLAFIQMGWIQRHQIFESAFREWLRNKTSMSLACGSSDYMTRLAGVTGEEPVQTFLRLSREFLISWEKSTTGEEFVSVDEREPQ